MIPSSEKFDLDEQNKLTARRFGYPQWEYWNFFTAPDAPKLMEADPSRMYEVNHGLYPSNIPEENGRDIWMREVSLVFAVPQDVARTDHTHCRCSVH